MKTLSEKFQAYKRLFRVTWAQTVTEGPEKAWEDDQIKKEVLK